VPTAKDDLSKLLCGLGLMLWERHWFAEARDCRRESSALAVEIGDLGRQGWASNHLGNAQAGLGQYGEAFASEQHTLECFEQIGDLRGAAWSANQLGDLSMARDDLAEAERHYRRSSGGRAACRLGRGVPRDVHAARGGAGRAAARGLPRKAAAGPRSPRGLPPLRAGRGHRVSGGSRHRRGGARQIAGVIGVAGLALLGLFSRENFRSGTLRARLRKFGPSAQKSALVATLGCRHQGSAPLVADIHGAGLRRNSSGASQGRLALLAP
jgi:hypothetical protein